MTSKDFDKLLVFATMKNGDIHSVAISEETARKLVYFIISNEGSVKIVRSPIDGIKHIKTETHDTHPKSNAQGKLA